MWPRHVEGDESPQLRDCGVRWAGAPHRTVADTCMTSRAAQGGECGWGGEKWGDPRIPGRRTRANSWGTPLQEECLKARKDCDPLTVRKTGRGDCEPRNATKDGCAGNVGGEVTGQVQLLPAGEGESYEG